MPVRRRRPRGSASAAVTGVVAVGLAAGLAGLGALTPASARPLLDRPGGEHVVAVGSSWFTVVAHGVRNATRYRVFASTNRPDLFAANIRGTRHSREYSRPRMTIGGLRYAAGPYYFRVEALNGRYHRFAGRIGAVGLVPAAPTSPRAASGALGTEVSWNAGPATAFVVEQSRSRNFSIGVRQYRTRDTGHVITPYGLTRGSVYWFRVAAVNAGTRSRWSTAVQTVPTTAEQPLRVMTWNVLEAVHDGRREGGHRVAPWSRRLVAVTRLVDRAHPDVLAVQEAAAWIGVPGRHRQVDTLRRALGGRYGLARTEIPPGHKGHQRTGVYLLYERDHWRPVGTGGHWDIGHHRWAAYHTLRNRQTGADVLAISVHLKVGKGRRNDRIRMHETQHLLSQARAYAGPRQLPVVYAGDFNSAPSHGHVFDGAGIAMRSAGVPDAFGVAQATHRQRFDTGNGYLRRPPRHGHHIDHVFAAGGVAVRSWRESLRLRHGRWKGTIPSDHNPVVADLLVPY